MSTYSNWREDLIEVIDTPTTEKKAEKKIKETKVNNKVVINPTFKESVAAMGGEILEMKEVDNKDDKKDDRNVEQKEKAKQEREDKNLKAKEKRVGMAKRMILQKKVQAVRAGAGADITAGYEPEGELIEGKKKGLDGKECWDGYKLAGTKKKGGKTVDNCVKVEEGIMKMVKKVIRSQKPEKKAEKATDAGARARRKLQQKDHEKVNFLPMEEGKGYQPEIEHSKLGDAKKKADKERESKLPPHLQGDAIGKMKKAFASEGEDKAFNFVVNKLKKKYGDGVLTKGDKIKPLTPKQKKKNAEIMAKRAKQDGRDATEKASDGRYSDRYSNRGSD